MYTEEFQIRFNRGVNDYFDTLENGGTVQDLLVTGHQNRLIDTEYNEDLHASETEKAIKIQLEFRRLKQRRKRLKQKQTI